MKNERKKVSKLVFRVLGHAEPRLIFAFRKHILKERMGGKAIVLSKYSGYF